MKQKFKVGDEVRVVNNDGFWHGNVDDILTVKYVSENGEFVGFKQDGEPAWCDWRFKLVTARLDLTKPVFTAEGTPVVVVTTQGRDPKYPVLAYEGKAKTLSKFTIDGKSKTGVARRHLTNVQATPEAPREFFVNLYDGDADISYGEPDVGGSMYGSIEAATNSYNQGRSTDKTHPKRVGIAKLVLVEGRLPKNVLKATDKEGK